MALPEHAPDWAKSLARGFESGAHGQFILHGNVADRFLLDGRRVGLVRCLDQLLLGGFELVFVFDAGNGLSLLRGGERLAQWPAMKDMPALPREPRAAIELITRYLRYRANLAALGKVEPEHVAVILRGVEQWLPASRQGDADIAAMASLLRDWATESPFTDMAFASVLIVDQLADLHPLLVMHPRVSKARIAMPDATTLELALAQLRVEHPAAFDPEQGDREAAQALTGVSLSALQSLVRERAHEGRRMGSQDWSAVKKSLIETEAGDLIEFIESRRSLEDYHAQAALKTWLRQDMQLWQQGDLRALPMGYLLCGPVGTGKTYLVECLAGEAGVPVVKLKNFRDRWVGSSEGNLEKIFRLIRALGRCMVFVDEADQTLGKRDGGSSDSGLSGRLYSMLAQEMSNGANRGRVMWLLASSRPDLIEVDLKRPGRVDVKIPLLPTTSVEESAGLLRALLKRFEIDLAVEALAELPLPLLLTPGAAEALAVKVYRQSRTQSQSPLDALRASLDGYQAPVPADVLRFQMRIAIREATDMAFVPPSLRALGDEAA
ncbi:MAG: ATP-binding protein [Lysobacteraceae bacterium]